MIGAMSAIADDWETLTELFNDGSTTLREALVRLWVMSLDSVRLNHWEQSENEKTVSENKRAFEKAHSREQRMALSQLRAAPLALIRALDDILAVHAPQARGFSNTDAVFAYDLMGTEYWLVPVPLAARHKAHTAQQAMRQSRWFHHHAVFPRRTAHGYEVRLQASRSELDERLTSILGQPSPGLGVWIAHFCDGADVVWDQNSSPVGNWRTVRVSDHAIRARSICATLKKCMEQSAQVVVFPEFTIDLEQRKTVREFLQSQATGSGPLIVVAGSFHAPVTDAASGNTYFNTAPVYGPGGRELFAHRKLRLFGEARVGSEHAEVGNQLDILLTPIGCMTVLICKDFCDDAPCVSGLLTEVPVDWVFVPSYGNRATLSLHKKKASQLARVTPGTSVAVAQTRNTAMDPKGRALTGFAHPAGQEKCVRVTRKGGMVTLPLAVQQRPRLSVVR